MPAVIIGIGYWLNVFSAPLVMNKLYHKFSVVPLVAVTYAVVAVTYRSVDKIAKRLCFANIKMYSH